MKEKRYVLLPQPIQKQAVQLLEKNGIEVVDAPEPDTEIIAPLMKNACAVVLRTGIHMTADLMDCAHNLLTISRTGAGFDNVDVRAATERGIIVTSSIGINTSTVVEHCLALMLCVIKQLFLLDREMRKGNFTIRYQSLPRDLEGRTLSIVGFGRIGSLLAEKCNRLFSMKVVAHDPYLDVGKREEYARWVDFVDFEEVFRQADVLSVHIPLTDETRGIITMKQLRLMKPDAIIINASRGGVVSEKDLIEALEKKIIAGAGLDVYEVEPVEENNPLLEMDNVVLTPHVAALTKDSEVRMALSAAQRVIDLLNGVRSPNIANPEVLAQERWRHLKKK